MLVKKFSLLLLLSLATVSLQAQELHPLTSGQSVEREIVGGQLHDYQITLQAADFVRVVVEQKAIDVALVLAAPDGKKVLEVNLTTAGGLESLSAEAAASGDYRLTVRAAGGASLAGSYQLRLEVRAAATAEDRQRIAAEQWMLEANELRRQGAKTADQAIDKLQQALSVWRELGDQYSAAWSLWSIGVANYNLSRNEKAIEYYEQALGIYREVKNRAGEGTTLGSLGSAYSNLRRYEKAIEYNDQALRIHREAKNRSGEGATLNNLGLAYSGLSRYDKAIEYYEQALAIHREVKNRTGEGSTLNSLANAYYNLSRNDEAIEYYEQALRIHREVKNRTGEGLTLGSLGSANSNLRRYEKAIEYNEQALRIHREVKNRAGEAATLSNLANNYYNLSRHDKSIEYYEQALPILREVKNRTSEGNAIRGLGLAYYGLSRHDKSIEYYEQALTIFREVKNRTSEGGTLMSLGIAYADLGRPEKAIEYYEQGLQMYREMKDRSNEGRALGNLGNAYRNLGRYEKALEYYEQILAIWREVKNRVEEGVTLGNLGLANSGLNHDEKGLEYYEQALAIAREVKNRVNEGTALANLGDAYYKLSRHEKALEYYEQALGISREVQSQSGQAAALYGLARADRAQGNLLSARTHIEDRLKISESMRADILSAESRASFLANVQSSYQLYTDVLMRQHQADPTKGFDAIAVETSERQRARSLLDLLAEARADVRQGVDTALVERERTLARQLNDKAQQQAQAVKPEQVAALKLEVSGLENDLERAQAAIRKASPHYAALAQPQPLKLKEIQAQLDADTLLLEYALGEERSYLWAITRDSLASYELPKEELINQSALQVYELLTARSTNKRLESAQQRQERITQAEAKLPAAARELSQTLLAPVAAQLGNKRLVIVADGALQYIPFAMLPEPSVVSSQLSVAKNKRPRTTDNGQPVIVRHEVVSLPSASALAIQRSELAGRQPAPKMLAVIADPVFDRSDPRFTTPATGTGDKTLTQTIAYDDARSIEHLAEKSGDKSGVTTLRVIPRLRFTRQEANRVLALTPKNSSFGAIDFEASRATALDPALGQYRYLHFATHGYLDSERPGLSALLFSMVDSQGKPVDGFLRANDIYNLKLPAELVVLSACQTGLGKDIKGEGLVGLTRGFMYAGAARVVVSLWNVNDKATADLMTKFYEKMLKQGERPAAALRAAQVEMWKQKQWQSPYYWAAFTMQGEWR